MFLRLGLSIPIASLAIGCVRGDVNMTVAPNLGRTVECVEPMGLPEKVADWLARHPEKPPEEWFTYEDWIADAVVPKLIKDCEE